MNKIHTINFDVDIIDYLADFILKGHASEGRDFSSFAVVFPGKRPQFYFRKSLAARIKKVFIPPRIFSIEGFIQYLVKQNIGPQDTSGSCQPVSLIDACFLIHEIVQNLNLTYLDWQKQLRFEHFFLWAKKILQFLEEMDKELVSESQLLNLQDNAQVGLPLPDYINHLLENINRIHTEFHNSLKKRRLTTAGFNYYQAAHSIDNHCPEEFKKIYFAGFFALNACEKKIIKSLFDKDLAVLFWQRDEADWSIFRELEEFFALRPQASESGCGPVKKSRVANFPKIQIYEGFDTHSQIQGVRDVLEGIKDLRDTCVVLPQADALMPLLYHALPLGLTDYNISLGYPLKSTPIYALIDMVIESQGRKRQDTSFYTKDYLKIIMHPYIKNIGGEIVRPDLTRILIHKIEEALLGIDRQIGLSKKPFIKLDEIEENPLIFQIAAKVVCDSGIAQIEPAALRKQLKSIHQEFFSLFDDCLTFADFVKAIQGMLYFILEKSQVFSDVFSGEAFSRFLEILESLSQSLFKEEPIKDMPAFFELFRASISLEKIPFTGTPVSGLQILGLLETRNLKFRNLVVLDLNEGVLPKTDKGGSLIPEGVFPMLGLPHYHKKEQIMRYHFRRLIGSAKNVFLFYQGCSRNNESRSRFIEEIIWQQEKKDKRLYEQKKIRHIEFKVVPAKESFALKKTPKVQKALQAMTFSPTALDTYLNCPARFYFRYCLGLKEKEEISEEFEASQIGNFLHELLRDFYSRFLNKPLELNQEAHDYLLRLKEKKLNEFFTDNSAELFLLSKVIDYRLDNFFRQEAKKNKNTKILYLEQSLPESKSRIRMDTQSGPAYLKGKIDRVDERILDGKKGIVIVDYKTGKYSLPKKNITRDCLGSRREIKKAIGSLQLPLYIYLFSESRKISSLGIQASFYSLREAKEDFLFDKNNPYKLLEIYLDGARRILCEILSPDVEFSRDDSNEHYCGWCPFAALCKR
ncbi:MAG: PD-(D/E)XK nuclease family protein [Candidatus Omnitrophota bacterium]